MDTQGRQETQSLGDPKALGKSTSGPEVAHETLKESIIEVAGYHRIDLGQWPSSFHIGPRPEHSIETSLLETFSASPASDLGVLKHLPIEMICSVVDFLPAKDCLRLRHVNRRMRDIITTIPSYRAVVTHGLECLRLVLRSNLEKYYTFNLLYSLLLQDRCFECGELAGFVYLPIAERACLNCLLDPKPTNPLETGDLSKLSPFYTINVSKFIDATTPHRSVLRYLMSKAIRDTGGVLHTQPGSFPAAHQDFTNHKRSYNVMHFSTCIDAVSSLPDFNQHAVWDLLNQDKFHMRFCQEAIMSSAAMPTFDPATGTACVGLSCKGCAVEHLVRGNIPAFAWTDEMRREMRHQNRQYQRDEFLEHFQDCEAAQKLWDKRDSGRNVWEGLMKSHGSFVRWGGWGVPFPLEYKR